MSFGSDPPPFRSAHDPNGNPYAATTDHGYAPPPNDAGKLTQLTIAGSVLIGLSCLSLGFALLSVIGNAMGAGANAPPADMPEAQRIGFYIGFWGVQITMFVFPLVAIVGGICMVLRKSHVMSIVGACASMVPLCGPCLGLTFPIGIWALVLLIRPEVKAAFG